MNIAKRKILGYEPMTDFDFSDPIYQLRQRYLTIRAKFGAEQAEALDLAGREVIASIDAEISRLEARRRTVFDALK